MNTLSIELLQEIALYLSYNDLMRYRNVNQECYKSCIDNSFWLVKFKLDFNQKTETDDNITLNAYDYVIRYGSNKIIWNQVYKRWHTRIKENMIINDNLVIQNTDIVLFYLRYRPKFQWNSNDLSTMALLHNNLDILEAMFGVCSMTSVSQVASNYNVVYNMKLQTLQWYETHFVGVIPSFLIIKSAVINNDVGILEWLKCERGNLDFNNLEQEIFNIIVKREDTCIFHWFLNQGLRLQSSHLIPAAYNGRLDILQLAELKHKFLMTTAIANAAAHGNNMSILFWLQARKVFPNDDGASDIAKLGYLHILDWLAEYSIYPNRILVFYVPTSNMEDWKKWTNNVEQYLLKHNVLQWLINKGIYPSQNYIHFLIRINHYKTVQYLYEAIYEKNYWEFNLDQNAINYATLHSDRKLSDWLIEQKRYPDHEAVNQAIQRNDINTVHWLAEHSIYPSTERIKITIKNSYDYDFSWKKLVGQKWYLDHKATNQIMLIHNR